MRAPLDRTTYPESATLLPILVGSAHDNRPIRVFDHLCGCRDTKQPDTMVIDLCNWYDQFLIDDVPQASIAAKDRGSTYPCRDAYAWYIESTYHGGKVRDEGDLREINRKNVDISAQKRPCKHLENGSTLNRSML